MSLTLPPTNHPARQLFDVSHVAAICAPGVRHQLPTLHEARRDAERIMEAGTIRGVTSIVMRANGDIALITFGPKGGRTIKWNFGKG